MRMTSMKETTEVLEFAKAAAKKFAENQNYTTFTTGPMEPGVLLAIRWGMGDDCVLVVRLDEFFEPVNFQQLVREV